MKKKIILIGGGGHCHSVIDVIEQECKYDIIGIIDKKEHYGNDVLGYKIIGCDNDLKEIFKLCNDAVIAIGQMESSGTRIKLFDKLKEIGFSLPIIISPLAYVSKHALIGEGTVIMHHAIVNANAKIGKNCIINSKALIEHDVIVGNNCHISTASVLNGGIVVKDNSFIGSNATIRQGIEIGGFIKAGSIEK